MLYVPTFELVVKIESLIVNVSPPCNPLSDIEELSIFCVPSYSLDPEIVGGACVISKVCVPPVNV